jgi:hypothetical protein
MAAHHRDRPVSPRSVHRNIYCQRLQHVPFAVLVALSTTTPANPVFVVFVFLRLWSQLPCRDASPLNAFTCPTLTVSRLISSRRLEHTSENKLKTDSLRHCRSGSAAGRLLHQKHVAKHGPSETLNLRHVLSHHESVGTSITNIHVHQKHQTGWRASCKAQPK